MSRYSILKDKKVVPCDVAEWARWMTTGERRVADETIGPSYVSTVFLGLDHQFIPSGPPLLFETMVFDGPLAGAMERCSTWEQAEKQHAAMVARIRESTH